MMHAHVYFESQSQNTAEKIRIGLLSEKWCLFIGHLSEKAIGPHPQSQFEVHFLEVDLLKAVRHFTLVREDLSVFVHVVSSNDFLDHTENCFWLGEKLELDFSKLDKEGENKALKRFLQGEGLSSNN